MAKVFRLVAAAVAVICVSGAAFAQTAATGNIEGVVTDASGGVLPGVTVVIKNAETNVAREVTSDSGGRYRATALQPGTYEVTANLAGFQAPALGRIEVLVGQTQAVDVAMRPAGVSEAVTVTGESPLIDTQRTDVSNVVGERAIENLPINGRRWENFVLLGPAVTNDGNFGLVSYRGISGLYNNNTVDGADNNQAFFSEARGRTRTSYSISQAAIKEFQVGVSNFSAEFGRAAGGTVNAITKSGTNTFHGEGFYFLRDDKFQAQDPFTPIKPDERRQQYGVSTGGPLRADKVFYFVNFDQQRRDFPLLRAPGPEHVPHRAVHGAGLRRDARVLQRARRLQSARRQQQHPARQGRLCDVESQQHHPAVQHAPLGLPQRRPDAAGHFGGAVGERDRQGQDRLRPRHGEHGALRALAQ